VRSLCVQFGVSERRACRVVGQPHSTQRLGAPEPTDDELALRAFLATSPGVSALGLEGAARATKDAGWRANHKRIHRLWIAQGLRVPYPKRKKPLRGIGQAVGAMDPIRPNVVWAMDFQFDQTSDGRAIKLLNVIDEYTREALATDVQTLHRRRRRRCLSRALGRRARCPAYVRFDHGPEFIAYGVSD
jgi:putative transposase